MSKALRLTVIALILFTPYALFFRLFGVSFVYSYAALSVIFLSWARVKARINVENLIKNHQTRRLTKEYEYLDTELSFLSQKLKIRKPKVYLSSLNELSATVTGLDGEMQIIVSEPLIKTLTESELRAVLSHELSHLALKDTSFIIYVQGLLSIGAFPMSQLLFSLSLKKDDEPFIFELLMNFSSLLIAFHFFRNSEHAADKMSLNLVKKEELIRALRKLYGPNQPLKSNYFSSHPSLSERISAL